MNQNKSRENIKKIPNYLECQERKEDKSTENIEKTMHKKGKNEENIKENSQKIPLYRNIIEKREENVIEDIQKMPLDIHSKEEKVIAEINTQNNVMPDPKDLNEDISLKLNLNEYQTKRNRSRVRSIQFSSFSKKK